MNIVTLKNWVVLGGVLFFFEKKICDDGFYHVIRRLPLRNSSNFLKVIEWLQSCPVAELVGYFNELSDSIAFLGQVVSLVQWIRPLVSYIDCNYNNPTFLGFGVAIAWFLFYVQPGCIGDPRLYTVSRPLGKSSKPMGFLRRVALVVAVTRILL